ncbi:MAG: hypothetical protein L3K14_08510 [Thermoplasmata archaeon]|nr:hypothetical protein [Thermoplasmata archaeon]
MPQIEAYNRLELTTLVSLMGKLKEGMYAAGIDLSQWYGAGAAATRLLIKEKAKASNPKLPPEVEVAALASYFGGNIQAGREEQHIEGPIYNYDLKSAYPDAMRTLPNLARGHWERYDPEEPRSYSDGLAVYQIEWEFPHGRPYYPLPWRIKEGAIYFPRVGRGWYWAPEVDAAFSAELLTYEPEDTEKKVCVKILDGWKFVPDDPTERAFPWIEELYKRRQEVGSKSGAGKAIKLALNALYGKTAQRAGVFQREPTYRNWAYAGYITSYVRSRLWGMAEYSLDSILSFATDGIYANEGLVPHFDYYKEGLGDWEETVYQEMDIAMAGVYRVKKSDGTWELFGRGFGKNGIPWDKVKEGWARGDDKLKVTVSRLHTLGECIHVRKGRPWVDREKWRSWKDEPKELRLKNPSLKRIGAEPFDPQFGVPCDSTPHDPRRSVADEALPPAEESTET